MASVGFPPEKAVKAISVEVDVSRTGLVVVDMQNDYCSPEGRHYIGQMAHAVVPKVRRLVEMSRTAGMRVIHTQSWYEEDDPRFSDHPKAAGKPGCGCKAGTWGAAFFDGLEPREGEPVIRKASFDPFFGTDFEDVLQRLRFGTFGSPSVHRNRKANDSCAVVIGVVANVCVEKAVIGLYNRGYDIVVPEDCVGAKDSFDQAWALFQFNRSYKARITNSQLLRIKRP